VVWTDQTAKEQRYIQRPQGGAWSTPTVIGTYAGTTVFMDGDAELASAADSSVHVVYTDDTSGNSEVYYRMKPAAGAWTSPVNLSNTASLRSDFAMVQVGVDGTLHAAWIDTPGSSTCCGDTYYVFKPPAGAWSSPVNVSLSSANGYEAALAVGPDGSAHLIWADEDGGPGMQNIYYAAKPSGGAFSAPVNLSGTANVNRNMGGVVVTPDLAVHVVYYEGLGANHEVIYQTKPSGGSWGGTTNISNASGNSLNAAIEVGTAGALHAVWQDNNSGNYDVRYATKPGGGAWTTPATIATTSGTSSVPRLATGTDGSLHTVWQDNTPGDFDVFYSSIAPLDPDGDVSVDKTAAPASVLVTNPVTVTLEITGVSPPLSLSPADAMLVIDRSGSMAGQPLADAKTGAQDFVDVVDGADGSVDGIITGSQVGVVAFDHIATLTHQLSTNASSIKAAIAALTSGGATAIGDGINLAQTELTGPRHLAANAPAMVVLSDGMNNSGSDPATEAANAKAAGTEMFSIALGPGADVPLMQGIASAPLATHYFRPLLSGDLQIIFNEIAQGLGGAAATSLVTNDFVGTSFSLVGTPSASKGTVQVLSSGTWIRWTLPEIRTETVSLTYQLVHKVGQPCGEIATNASATLTFVDSLGSNQQRTYPQPVVNVDDGDGLTPAQEAVTGTDPCRADTDGDGFYDGPVDVDGSGGPGQPGDNCLLVPNPTQANSDSGPPPPAGNTGAIGNGPGIAGHDGTVPNGDPWGDLCDSDDDNDGLGDFSGDWEPGVPRDLTLDDDADGNPAFDCYGGEDTSDDGVSWDTDCDGKIDGAPLICGSSTNDADGDGLMDAWETCHWATSNTSTNTDGDSMGDCREAMDVNGNAVLTNADATFVQQAFFDIIGADWDFDINGNGVITNGDATFVRQAFFAVNPCL
jgi:uncharacterized protein YegL